MKSMKKRRLIVAAALLAMVCSVVGVSFAFAEEAWTPAAPITQSYDADFGWYNAWEACTNHKGGDQMSTFGTNNWEKALNRAYFETDPNSDISLANNQKIDLKKAGDSVSFVVTRGMTPTKNNFGFHLLSTLENSQGLWYQASENHAPGFVGCVLFDAGGLNSVYSYTAGPDSGKKMPLEDSFIEIKVADDQAKTVEMFQNGKHIADLGTTADYPDGAYMAFSCWALPGGTSSFTVSKFNTAVAYDYSSELIMPAAAENITFSYANIEGDNIALEATLSKTGGETEVVAVPKTTGFVVDTATKKVTILKEWLATNAGNFPDLAKANMAMYDSTVAENAPRSYVGPFKVLLYDPPTVKDGVSATMRSGKIAHYNVVTSAGATQDLTFTVNYEGDDLKVMADVANPIATPKPEDPPRAEIGDTIGTVTRNASEKTYSVTIKKEYVNEMALGGHFFSIETKAGNLTYMVFVEPTQKGWIGGTDDVLTPNSGTYQKLAADEWKSVLNGRAYYSEGFDVSKPIYLQMSQHKYPQWCAISLDRNPFSWSFSSEGTGLITFIWQTSADSGSRWQPMTGGDGGSIDGAEAFLEKAGMLNVNNLNTVEINIAEDAKDSVIKFNGQKAFQLKVKRSDFDEMDGKMYLSLYMPITNVADGPYDMTLSRNPASGLTALYEQHELTYQLRSGADLTIGTLYNYDPAKTMTVKNGAATLTKDTDYTVKDGKLVIKAAYLNGLAYSLTNTFTVMQEGSGFDANVRTTVGETANGIALKSGEDAVKIFDTTLDGGAMKGANVAFEFSLPAGDEFQSLIYDEKPLTAGTDYTFVNGVLTIKKEFLAPKGDDSLLDFVVVSKKGAARVFVLMQNFDANGYAPIGDAAYTCTDGVLAMNAQGLVQAKAFADLTKGIAFEFNVKDVNGFYNGANADSDPDARFVFKFKDPDSGNVIVITIRPNADATHFDYQTVRTLIQVAVYDATETEKLSSGTTNLELNRETVGTVKLQFKTADGKLVVYGQDKAGKIKSLSLEIPEMSTDSLIMTVGLYDGTTKDVADSVQADLKEHKMSFELKSAAFDAESETPPAGGDEDEGGGCKGCNSSAAAMLGATVLLVAGLAFVKRH